LTAALVALGLLGVGLWALGKRAERGIERGRRTRWDEKWGGEKNLQGVGEGEGSEMELRRGSGKVSPDA
jgi:hypothetical protein